MSTAYVALGANLPFEALPPQDTLRCAVIALAGVGFEPLAASSLWRSPAWPPSDQPDYNNAVVAVEAGDHPPQALYEVLRKIETRFGRERRELYAARTLDLDIVALDGVCGVFGGIILPHPRMAERAFVLAPLAEIAPSWWHPALGQTAADLLAALPLGQVERVGPL
ncbi:MAG: 2-amino-4-hydroxy-6-hydroxymethyldihydropteridine diphosphokinase [Terricaulis sp.]